VCHNCNQLGHLTRDCQNPCTTYRYCHDIDHVIEDFHQLLAKMQERRNQGAQPNLQKISVERRTDDQRIQAVTRSGAMTEDKKEKQLRHVHHGLGGMNRNNRCLIPAKSEIPFTKQGGISQTVELQPHRIHMEVAKMFPMTFQEWTRVRTMVARKGT